MASTVGARQEQRPDDVETQREHRTPAVSSRRECAAKEKNPDFDTSKRELVLFGMHLGLEKLLVIAGVIGLATVIASALYMQSGGSNVSSASYSPPNASLSTAAGTVTPTKSISQTTFSAPLQAFAGHKACDGVCEQCYGPIRVPKGARTIVAFHPILEDIRIVHHMIVFGASTKKNPIAPKQYQPSVEGAPLASKSDGNPCNPLGNSSVLFSWARTGQKRALPFDLPAETGVDVGHDEDQTQWLFLAIHYQNLKFGPHKLDSSGVNITYSSEPAKSKVKIQSIMNANISIPPQTANHTICTVCDVQVGGTVVAFRNHAHRLAADLYSDVVRQNMKVRELGRTKGTTPQIFYLADGMRGVDLLKNDKLVFYCVYDSRGKATTTVTGADERTHEMCNQYLMLPQEMDLSCRYPQAWHVNDQCGQITNGHFSASTSWPLASPSRSCPADFCRLGQVTGVDVDLSTGEVFVFHRSGRSFWNTEVISDATIFRLSSAGVLLQSLGSGLFKVPHGLTVIREGADVLLWLTDTVLHQVFQMAVASGKIVHTLGMRDAAGDGATHFNKPTHVVVNSAGSLFIADGYGNSRVAVFARDSPAASYTFRSEFGIPGKADGQFNTPHGLALDGKGRIYVADRNNGRIQVFKEDGTHVSVWDPVITHLQVGAQPWRGYVSAIAFDKVLGVLYALVGGSVVMYDVDGNVLQKWGRAGQGIGELDFPHALSAFTTTSSSGALESGVYVAELMTQRVQKFEIVT